MRKEEGHISIEQNMIEGHEFAEQGHTSIEQYMIEGKDFAEQGQTRIEQFMIDAKVRRTRSHKNRTIHD